ncbi:hypothetical protein ACFWG7_13100 [Streptomyces koyangensis]|uniref:hypothetical protein n=1 Tax=Streptomyces koyangensis TaxID=188770 RepID=UPI00364F1CC7
MDGLDRTRGVRLRRSAVAALALSGTLAGCGLVEPKQTYEQAYEAMRPDAMAAMGEAWPGVEMEQYSADFEECGGLDISADKDASKLSAHVTYQGNVRPVDERSLAELARAAGKRLMERGWRSGAVAQWRRGENTGRGGPEILGEIFWQSEIADGEARGSWLGRRVGVRG